MEELRGLREQIGEMKDCVTELLRVVRMIYSELGNRKESKERKVGDERSKRASEEEEKRGMMEWRGEERKKRREERQ